MRAFLVILWCLVPSLVEAEQSASRHADSSVGESRRGESWSGMTCKDVRAIVERVGEAQAIAVAQAYGAGESQIAVARQCLLKKTKR